MATFYSDLFAGATSAVLDPQKRANAGVGHGRFRYKRSEVTASMAMGDVVRMMTFDSNDRLHALYFTHEHVHSGGAGYPAGTTFAYDQDFTSGTDSWVGVNATLTNPGGYLHVAPDASPGWSGITKTFTPFAGGSHPYVVMGMKDNAGTGTWLGELNYTYDGGAGHYPSITDLTNGSNVAPIEADGYATIYWDLTSDYRWMGSDIAAISGNGMVPWNPLHPPADGDYDITYIQIASAAPISGVVDVGLYKAGRSHDGPEIDKACFVSMHNAKAIHNHVSRWNVSELARGAHLWKVADYGAASYSADPEEAWDVVIHCGAGSRFDSSTMILEAHFTTGD